MISKYLVCLGFLTVISLSCKKGYEEFTGTIKDFTGLDGCGKVIVLDNGTVLEPGEFSFGTIFTTDKRVAISYQKMDNKNSNCMVGPIVKILTLRYL